MGIASSVCLQLIAKQAEGITVLGSEAEEATEGILHTYAKLNFDVQALQ